MAITDQVQSTPNAPDAVTSTQNIAKRKRSNDVNGTKGEEPKEQSQDPPPSGSESLHAFLTDVHDILTHQDARFSILNTPLPSTASEPHPAKRAKLATVESTITIAAKVRELSYRSIEEFVTDLDNAALVVRNKREGVRDDTARNGEILNATETQIAAFKSMANELIRREMVRKPQTFGQIGQDAEDTTTKDKSVPAGLTSTGRMMLTLNGKGDSHYGPSRQLFSSLQRPVENERVSNEAIDPMLHSVAQERVYPPLRETALPNGIFASRNIPTNIGNGKPKVPTIGALFAPPAHLPQLTPPRQSKHTTTRSQTVTFFDPQTVASAARPRGRGDHYTVQALSTGQWLSYNASPSALAQDTKKRKRGQSFNDVASPNTEETPDAQQMSDNDALFKSAYSSFAPNRDDSTALIPEKLKNRIWWDRYGARKFHSHLQSQCINYSYGIDGVLAEDTMDEISGEDQAEEFKKMVEEYGPAEQPPEFQASPGTGAEKDGQVSEKDVDELLAEISEAIETLASHQRARSLIPTSSTPAPTGLGSPSTPSTAELDVYSLLKSQLKIMISSLPPFAVAKLNGDQLDSLAITTRMPVEGNLGRGIMEDPEAASRVRTAAAASTAIPPVVRQTYPSRSGYTNTPTAPSSRYSNTSSYSASRTSLAASYPSQTYSGRDTATAHFSSYPPQQSAAAVRRPFTGNQPHHGAYANGVPPRQSSYNSSLQYSSSTPQRPSQPSYQQRAQNSTPSYSNYNSTSMSTNSTSYVNHSNHLGTPGNSASYSNYSANPRINSYHPHNASSRPSYPASTTATASTNNHAYSGNTHDPNAPRGAVVPPNSTPNTSIATTVGQRMGLTPDEQAMLMRRQQEKLAMQNQNRHGPNGHSGGGGAMESSRFAGSAVGAGLSGEGGQ